MRRLPHRNLYEQANWGQLAVGLVTNQLCPLLSWRKTGPYNPCQCQSWLVVINLILFGQEENDFGHVVFLFPCFISQSLSISQGVKSKRLSILTVNRISLCFCVERNFWIDWNPNKSFKPCIGNFSLEWFSNDTWTNVTLLLLSFYASTLDDWNINLS